MEMNIQELAKTIENQDLFKGLLVSVSGYGATQIPLDSFNAALERAGFHDLLLETVKPSTCYLDAIRSHSMANTNLRKSNFIYQFVKLQHDTTNAGKIVHNVIKITKSGMTIDDNETHSVAQITFSCSKVNKMEINDKVVVTSDDGGHEDIQILQDFVDDYNLRKKQFLDTPRIIDLINKVIQSSDQFRGIKMRRSGGIYLVPRNKSSEFLEYIDCIIGVCPEISPLMIPIFENSPGYDTTKTALSQSISEELLLRYKSVSADIESKMKALGENKNVRQNTLINLVSEIQDIAQMASESSSDFNFDLSRCDLIKEKCNTQIKELYAEMKKA